MNDYILAFDTAMSACSACVSKGDRVLSHRFRSMERGQAEILMPMIADVLSEAGIGPDGLGLVATTVGPGAFTGVRIGIATARGLALGRGVPVLGLTTMEAVAAANPTEGPLLVVLETKRSDFYVQLFRADGALGEAPQAMEADAILAGLPGGPIAVVGDGADRLIEVLGVGAAPLERVRGPDIADATVLAALAARRLRDGADPSGFPALRPLYLRPPDVVMPGR